MHRPNNDRLAQGLEDRCVHRSGQEHIESRCPSARSRGETPAYTTALVLLYLHYTNQQPSLFLFQDILQVYVTTAPS